MIASMVLQALGYALRPLITAFMRLILFLLPIAFLFSLTENAVELVWLSFPVAEILTSIFSLWFLKDAYNKKIKKYNTLLTFLPETVDCLRLNSYNIITHRGYKYCKNR